MSSISKSLKPEGLYLAIREKDKKTLYLFCDDSYNGNSINPIKTNLKLKEKEYYICIMLGFDGDFHEYGVLMNNDGKSPTFEEVDLPLEIRGNYER